MTPPQVQMCDPRGVWPSEICNSFVACASDEEV